MRKFLEAYLSDDYLAKILLWLSDNEVKHTISVELV